MFIDSSSILDALKESHVHRIGGETQRAEADSKRLPFSFQSQRQSYDLDFGPKAGWLVERR
jgi:hypothetical protein